jgi:hypothetical protein
VDKEYTAGEAKAWLNGYDQGKKFASKEWVNLTDEEINDVFGEYMDSLDEGEEDDNWGYERLIEAKLKEKNENNYSR